MTAPPGEARAVIVGGGIAGCSVAYHLGKLGWRDVVLLERKALTCGTTWHAAGLVGQLRASRNLTRLAKYSADLYARLEAETGVATGMRRTGSIILALTEARREELLRQASLARAFEVEVDEISPAEAAALYPHVEVADAVAAVHLPGDGQCDPANVAMALAKGARRHGATLIEGVKVTGVRRAGGRVTGVDWAQGEETRQHPRGGGGELRRHVGARARRRRRRDPAAARLRAFLHRHRADRRPRAAAGAAGAGRMRLLQGGRGQAPARRLRAGGQALGHGRHPRGLRLRPAARGRRPLRADPGEGGRRGCRCWPRPASRPSSTGPRASPRTTATISARRRSSRGYWVAAGFNSIGIASAGGAGYALAQWIEDGAPPFDLWDVDIRRAQPFQRNRRYLRERVSETLGLLYADHFPYRQPATARGVRRSPLHAHLARRGAVFGEVAGWERANWFARDGEAREYRYGWGRQNWFENQRAEHLAVREGVGLFDLSSFGKIRVEGRDACALLQRLCGNDVDVEAGRIVYTQMLNRRGGIESDLTATRLSETAFLLVVPGATLQRDLAWLRRHVGDAFAVITDVSAAEAVFAVMGPKARDLMRSGEPGRLLATPATPTGRRARSSSAWGSPGRTGCPMWASSAGSSTSRRTRPPTSSRRWRRRARRTGSGSAACMRSIAAGSRRRSAISATTSPTRTTCSRRASASR